MSEAEAQSYRWLLGDKYQLSPSQIHNVLAHWFQRQEYLQPEIFHQLEQDLERLRVGEPIQYVIGSVPFLNCHIDLSLKPLIPRPETEFWVSQFLAEMKKEWGSRTPIRVLDLCCGSGCIGLSVLKNFSAAGVDFVDISPVALEQTRLNLEHNQLAGRRVQLFQSDLFAHLPSGNYDLILANPPYVDRFGEYSGDLQFEPAQAIFAQNSGLELIEQIILKSKMHLKSTGKLVIEFGQNQANVIKKLLIANGWTEFQFRVDQFDRERWVVINMASPKLKKR